MSDDPFLDRIREEARPLRYEPDPAVLNRLRAAVASRVEETPGAWTLLGSWLRPFAAVVVTAVVVSGSLLVWNSYDSTDQLGSVAEAALVQEDFYRVAP